jgi:hypothetical protein
MIDMLLIALLIARLNCTANFLLYAEMFERPISVSHTAVVSHGNYLSLLLETRSRRLRRGKGGEGGQDGEISCGISTGAN